jgi:hypothetical protein
LLLSSLLVASIVAFHGHARQIKRANRTNAAVKATDKLLSRWFGISVNVPPQAAGQNDVLAWQIIRLQITDTESPSAGRPLVEVDVVVSGGWPSQAVP